MSSLFRDYLQNIDEPESIKSDFNLKFSDQPALSSDSELDDIVTADSGDNDTSWAPVSIVSWMVPNYVHIEFKLIFFCFGIHSSQVCFIKKFFNSQSNLRPFGLFMIEKGPTCAAVRDNKWLELARRFHKRSCAIPCDRSLKWGCFIFSICNPLLNQHMDEITT